MENGERDENVYIYVYSSWVLFYGFAEKKLSVNIKLDMLLLVKARSIIINVLRLCARSVG